MLFNKITVGFVIQTFNDQGECVEQEFVAGDEVSYETKDGDEINEIHMPFGGNECYPFSMEQPINKKICHIYPKAKCPDCGNPIPKYVILGESCENCEHVFLA